VATPEPLTADTIKNATIVAQREAAARALLEARLTLERCDRALLYDADARQACADQANEASGATNRARRALERRVVAARSTSVMVRSESTSARYQAALENLRAFDDLHQTR
jgi:membrane-bound lytic murein transglycosylase